MLYWALEKYFACNKRSSLYCEKRKRKIFQDAEMNEHNSETWQIKFECVAKQP